MLKQVCWTATCDMSGDGGFFWRGVTVIPLALPVVAYSTTDAEIAAPSTEKVAVSKKVP